MDEARTYWRALGFADVGEAVAFTVADIRALRCLVDLVRDGVIDERTAIGLVRGLGRMTGRLADWHVETLSSLIELPPGADAAGTGRLSAAYELGERLLPEFERLLV